MKKTLGLLYGIFCYLAFLSTSLYAVGFVGNFLVPKSMDTPESGSFPVALFVNTLVLGVFAVQHSVMARQGFKQEWTKIIPNHLERSSYVLFSSLALTLLFYCWRPMGALLWDYSGTTTGNILIGISFLGWLIVLVSTVLINHFELFGLQQVVNHFRGKKEAEVTFKTPALYKLVRHPIYLGFIIAFWATCTMTVGHLVFAIGTTVYILIGVQLEERDLIQLYGDTYRQYKARVSMLFPHRWPGKRP